MYVSSLVYTLVQEIQACLQYHNETHIMYPSLLSRYPISKF
jgi:hypothetical protein